MLLAQYSLQSKHSKVKMVKMIKQMLDVWLSLLTDLILCLREVSFFHKNDEEKLIISIFKFLDL